MNIGVYQSAASLSAIERWQDAVTQNITASQVPGFKKRTVEFSGLNMGEMSVDAHGKMGQGQPAMFPTAVYGVNFQSGETNPTGRELDVAIQGEGFLEVKLGDGSHGYTRAGSFHLRTDRTLTDGGDNPLLSEGGSPMSLLPDGGSVAITAEGTITQGSNQLGKLSVVKFKDNSKLVPLGGGLFHASDGAEPSSVDKPQVLQGYLEGSNVTPLREMVALVQIARAYEANQKVITSRDQTSQKVLDTLG